MDLDGNHPVGARSGCPFNPYLKPANLMAALGALLLVAEGVGVSLPLRAHKFTWKGAAGLASLVFAGLLYKLDRPADTKRMPIRPELLTLTKQKFDNGDSELHYTAEGISFWEDAGRRPTKLFQLDFVDPSKELPFSNSFNCYKGPDISRYDTMHPQRGALLVRMRLTKEQAERIPIPHRPNDGIGEIAEAYFIVWGDMPEAPDESHLTEFAQRSHLQYQPHSLLLDNEQRDEQDRVQMGLFVGSAREEGVTAVRDEFGEADDYGTSYPLGINRLVNIRFDVHDRDNYRVGHDEAVVDQYGISTMGVFDLSDVPLHVSTTVIQSQQKGTIVIYNWIAQRGARTQDFARIVAESETVGDLFQALNGCAAGCPDRSFGKKLGAELDTLGDVIGRLAPSDTP